MLTPVDCFENADFCAFWDAIESLHCRGWDDGPMLELLVDCYCNGFSVEDAAAAVLEADDIARAEYWMAIPSWA